MIGGYWYRELKGAAGFWIAALLFTLMGGVFTTVGVLVEPFFLLVGLPFLGLGLFVLVLLIYSLYLKVKHPEKYPGWLWWINFIGGLAGALLFAVPSTFALPILLLLDLPADTLWIGVLFSVIGAIALVVVVLIGRWQYKKRLPWTELEKADENPKNS